MDTVLNIILFVVALSLLAFLHELGHYLTSRLFKIEVEEFGIGFPPKVLTLFRFGGTDFTLNLIPFGAFVRPKGENDPDVPGGLAAANPWARLVVLFGGPVMNLIVGIALFALVFQQIGSGPDLKRVEIVGVFPNSPAAQAGIRAGDVVYSFNGEVVDSKDEMSTLVKENLDQPVTLLLVRRWDVFEAKLTPRRNPPEGEGAMGIYMSNPLMKINYWHEALPMATYVTYEQSMQLFMLPVRLIQGTIAPAETRFVGPVGMYGIFDRARQMDAESAGADSSQAASQPAVNTLSFIATISIALGLTNLLPLPALDGGRIIFALPEIVLRKRVPAKYENMIHAVGFLALITLLFVITAQDILNPIKLP